LSHHLLPEDSPFQHWEIRGEYHLSIARRLLPEVNPRPVIATVVCLPSFDPEWAIRIHGNESNGFAATLTAATAHIWGAEQDTEIEVSQRETELPSELAKRLLDTWRKILRNTMYQSSASAGLDGVTYHFSCHRRSKGRLSGQTLSPDPESTAGHFVSLAQILRNYICNDSQDRITIKSQITQKLDWFNDVPIRPPLRENASLSLKKTIKQLLEYHDRGILTDTEFVGQIAYAFEHVRYPDVVELIDIIELIPDPMRNLIRETVKE